MLSWAIKGLKLTVVFVDVITGSDVDSISKNDLDLLIKENGGEYRQNKTAGILIAGFSSKSCVTLGLRMAKTQPN